MFLTVSLEMIQLVSVHNHFEIDSILITAAFLNAYTQEPLPFGPPARSRGQWIRANRSKLRTYLSTEVDIKWGKRFTRYEVENNIVKAFFEDGSSAIGTILVGADGVASPGMNADLGQYI